MLYLKDAQCLYIQENIGNIKQDKLKQKMRSGVSNDLIVFK